MGNVHGINTNNDIINKESHLIGTIARCKLCGPSKHWLGNHSPKRKIRVSGLWLVQHLRADEIDGNDEKTISDAIKK